MMLKAAILTLLNLECHCVLKLYDCFTKLREGFMARDKQSTNPLLVLGIGVVAIIIIVAGVYFFLSYRATSNAKQQVNDMVEKLAMFGQVDYESVSASPFNDVTQINDINIRPHDQNANPIKIKEVKYRVKKDSLGDITNLNIDVTSLSTNLQNSRMGPMEVAMLKKMGLLNLNSDINVIYSYKPEESRMMLKLNQKFIGLGNLGFGLILGQFKPDINDPMAAMGVTINHIRIRYTDHGLIRDLVKILAETQGLTNDQMLDKMHQMAKSQMAKQNNPQFNLLVDKIILFLRDPKNITFDANPEPPVALGELQMLQPDEIGKRLNLIVAVNQ